MKALILLFTVLISNIQKIDSDLYGNWAIYKYIDGNISGLSEIEKQSFMNMKFYFQSDSACINGEKFIKPIYEFRNENSLNYLYYNYKTNKEYLGIESDTLTIINISDSNYNSFEFLSFGGNLVLNIDGVFFFLKKEFCLPTELE